MVRPSRTLLAVLGVAASACSPADDRSESATRNRGRAQPGPASVPAAGWISDSATAVSVAESALASVYGAREIRAQHPLVATHRDSVWIVEGTLPPDYVGGVARVELSQRDGRVLRMSHGL